MPKFSVYCISFVFNTSLSLCYVPIAQDPLHLSRDLMARTVDFSRLWHSYTSYMCSAVFHPMYHFLQFILICHFPSHLSCHWSFLVVKHGISLSSFCSFRLTRYLLAFGKSFIRPFEVLYKAFRRWQQQTQAAQPLGLAADNMCNEGGSEIQWNLETNAFSKAKQHSPRILVTRQNLIKPTYYLSSFDHLDASVKGEVWDVGRGPDRK